MSSPWLSVLIPVYNVEEYLEDCIRSVISQVDTGVEIVLVDDCSTDGSFVLAQALVADSVHPIRLLRQEKNSGISAVRNALVEAAKGEYLWFLDSDDILMCEAISSLRQVVNRFNPDLILCDYQIWYQNGVGKSKNVKSFSGAANILSVDPMELFSGLFQVGKLHLWSKISKRSLWSDSLKFPVGHYFEDVAVTPRLALLVESYFYVDTPWVRYRQREGSILAAFNEKKIRDMVLALDGIDDAWRQKNLGFVNLKCRYSFYQYSVRVLFYVKKELKKIQRNDLFPMFRTLFFDTIKLNKFELAIIFLRNRDLSKFFKVIFLI